LVEKNFTALGAVVEVRANYPAWTVDPQNPLAVRLMEVLGTKYNYELVAAAGGIEPSVFLAKKPGMSAINFALASIKGAHSPQERIDLTTLDEGLAHFKILVEAVTPQKPE
jgi:di/tripeptidase